MIELFDLDQFERDSIANAINDRILKLKKGNRTEHIQKLVDLHKPDFDIVQIYISANQAEINKLEAVENYFKFMRFT